MRWSYVLRARERWLGKDDAIKSHERDATELLLSLGLEEEDDLALIARADRVVMRMPYRSQEEGWAASVMPWEYLISTATRRHRRASGNSFTVMRAGRVDPRSGCRLTRAFRLGGAIDGLSALAAGNHLGTSDIEYGTHSSRRAVQRAARACSLDSLRRAADAAASIMCERLTKKEAVLSLFDPRPQLKGNGTTLRRPLVFMAAFVNGDQVLPSDLPQPQGGPAQQLTAEVHLEQFDQVGNSGWLEWTAMGRNGDRGARMSFVETESVNCTFTEPLAKEATESANSFHARRRKLLLSVKEMRSGGTSLNEFRDCRISAILKGMKATVTVTSRGVVTLPAKLRAAVGIRADDQLIVEATPEGLLLRPAVTLPVEIYSPSREREFDEAEAELARAMSRRQTQQGSPESGRRKQRTVSR